MAASQRELLVGASGEVAGGVGEHADRRDGRRDRVVDPPTFGEDREMRPASVAELSVEQPATIR